MTVDRLKTLVINDFEAVNILIIDKIKAQAGLIDDLSHYIVESGGKRLRPLLVLLASHACNYQGQNHILLAAMVEFFHTATLLHDDVIDESTLRRGKETANEIWGSKASILVGDYLVTQSVQLMVQVKSWPVISLMADTSHQITLGEVKQLANRHNPTLSTDDYLDVIRSKTALLFAACAKIGALLGNMDETVQSGLFHYGLHLGNAFQMIDDALDYSADTKIIGKNTGDDLADGMITMPLLHALQNGTPEQQILIKQALVKGGLQDLPAILNAIKSTNAIELTKKFAAREVDAALSSLQVLPDSIYKEALVDLAQFALDRTY